MNMLKLERRLTFAKCITGAYMDAEDAEWESWAAGEYGGRDCACCGGPITNEDWCLRRTDDSGPLYHPSCTEVSGMGRPVRDLLQGPAGWEAPPEDDPYWSSNY